MAVAKPVSRLEGCVDACGALRAGACDSLCSPYLRYPLLPIILLLIFAIAIEQPVAGLRRIQRSKKY